MKPAILFLFSLLLLIVAGCDGIAATPTVPTLVPTSTVDANDKGIVTPVLASSELVVGPERFVFGLIDPKTNQPIGDVPEVTIQFFKVHEDGTATKTGDAQPIFRNQNLPAGVYVVRTTFSEPGAWGALMNISRKGFEPYQVKANFTVSATSTVPMVGRPAPPSNNQTTTAGFNIDEIDSAQPHDNMHNMTIADALKSGKPTLVLFAAPGYCPSFTCGPDLELVQTLQAKYGDKANFIHIESPNTIQDHTHEGPVPPDHRQQEGHRGVLKPQVKTAEEWGLKSEPWLFFIDKNGNVADRYEGGLTLDEVEPEFSKLVQ